MIFTSLTNKESRGGSISTLLAVMFLVENSAPGDFLIWTMENTFARCNFEAKEGNKVCIILGCSMPSVLRPVGEQFEIIGEAYMYVIMYGETMKHLNLGLVELREFELR